MSYLRDVRLTLSDAYSSVDLSALRFTFATRQWDLSTPNIATIMVDNVSAETAQTIQEDYSRVVLQAGYIDEGFGTLFDGELAQVRRGRRNGTDTYLQLDCTDGFKGYALTVVSTAMAAGSTSMDRYKALTAAFGDQGVMPGEVTATMPDTSLPRGKVMFGMARDHMDVLADQAGARWSVQNNKLTLLGDDQGGTGSIITLGPTTGLIGIPEQTQEGIRVRSLINPNLRVGGQIKLDATVNEQTINLSRASAATTNPFIPPVSGNGIYRIIVMEHHGDTRGQEWYSDLTCLAVDSTILPAGLSGRGYVNSDAQSGVGPGGIKT